MTTRVLGLLIASCVAATTVKADEPTSLSDAQAAIEANLKTPEGKAYEEKLGAEFLEHHMSVLKQCKQREARRPESFWMLLKLDASGAVRELLLHPTTPMGTCARVDLLKGQFAPPPHGGYWVGIFLELAH